MKHALVYMALLVCALTFGATYSNVQSKPAPPVYVALRVFVEYRELGVYDVYVVTPAGERLELNALCARDGLAVVGYGGLDAQGYTVWVFELP